MCVSVCVLIPLCPFRFSKMSDCNHAQQTTLHLSRWANLTMTDNSSEKNPRPLALCGDSCANAERLALSWQGQCLDTFCPCFTNALSAGFGNLHTGRHGLSIQTKYLEHMDLHRHLTRCKTVCTFIFFAERNSFTPNANWSGYQSGQTRCHVFLWRHAFTKFE